MHTTASAALLLLAGQAMAQSSVVSIWGLGADDQALYASVVSANPSATVLAINCPSGEDSTECGFDGAVTITEGPSTLHIVTTAAVDAGDLAAATTAADTAAATSGADLSITVTVTLDCTRTGTADGTCAYTEEVAGTTSASTTTLIGTDLSEMPITITAGLSKLASATGSSAQTTAAGSSGFVTSGSGKKQPFSFRNTVGRSNTATATGKTTAKTTGSTAKSSSTATGSAASSTPTGAAAQNLGLGASIAGAAGVLVAALAL